MRHNQIARARSLQLLPSPQPWTRIETLLFALICAATLAFAIITPPFQAPDENQHFFKAAHLANGRTLADRKGDLIGAHLPRAAVHLHATDFPTDVGTVHRRFNPAHLAAAIDADAARTGTTFAEFPNVASYAPTLYTPGALGLRLSQNFGVPQIGSFYIGRIVNALTGLGLLCLALRLMPFGRRAMLATALLPTFAYQTGSLSPDAIINGLGFVGLALSLRMASGAPAQSSTRLLPIAAPLLALAKGVYLPLLGAGLRWPIDRRSWLILATMALGAATFVGWMHYSGGGQALYHIQSRKTSETMMTAPLADQLRIVLADPTAYVRILTTSVAERAPVYFLQIIGRFGWNAILLPLLAYPLACLMIAGAIFSGTGLRIRFTQRLWWLTVAAGVALLIETAMYLTATPLGADYVQGTQGRYFLPLLPLVLLALTPSKGRIWAPRLLAISAALLLTIALATVVDSFWVHGFVTRDGMPPHRSITSALILPSPRW